MRRGPGHPGFDLAQENTRAITDGLNQVPRESGETIRGVDVGGDPRLAELVAGPYEPGSVVVEPAFSSASIKTGEFATSKFGDDVELHVRSDNIRDISKLAENPGERESLSPPGTQLLVHEQRLEITPEGRRKWVIEAEEIGPGHPRYLDPEAAQQKMAERRAENDHNAAEFERRKQESDRRAPRRARRAGGGAPPADLGPRRRSTARPRRRRSGADAGLLEPGARDEPARRAGHPRRRGDAGGARGLRPATAIRTCATSTRASTSRARWRTATSRTARAGPRRTWDRLHGGDATAEPIPLHEMGSRGTLEHIEGRFGETFSGRGELRRRHPRDARAAGGPPRGGRGEVRRPERRRVRARRDGRAHP